jgi:choline dehydrogenase-like flavoprotein
LTSPTSQVTDFTRDILGRYICNGLEEALRSTNASIRADAKPFDVIIVGGGTFGPVLAHRMFQLDQDRSHRILVLEGGPFVLPEHVQNLPVLGLGVPGATSIADLRAQGGDGRARAEVWGLAWHSPQRFPGLAYCIGGRSLYWGGWSPQLMDGEMPRDRWPEHVVDDLNDRYFAEAGRQIGVSEANDFIRGPLHEVLLQRLFDGIEAGAVAGAVPLDEVPLQVETPGNAPPADRRRLRLEAPLGVQASTRPGFFPTNKFSAMPLLTKAARLAYMQSGGDEFQKRLMIVPHCHASRLLTNGQRVTAVRTNLGDVPLPEHGIVVLALGTIETTRLALLSFEGMPGYGLIGKNLLAHLRSNLTIRIPRDTLGIDPAIRDLSVSALFVKGRHRHADGSEGHFHLQITASGLGSEGTDSEAELFKKVPDIDLFAEHQQASDTHVVVTIRGIGEMVPDNPISFVRLDSELDEFGHRRAFVSIQAAAKDLALWDAMDQAARNVAVVLAGGAGNLQVLGEQRDGLGTTHHEAGPLRMGTDPATSVTDGEGRFHAVSNAYVAGPAVFPTIGSPNPMLTGVAMARRLTDRLLARPAKPDGFSWRFDGTSLAGWHVAGAGTSRLFQGAIELVGGEDLGLLWHDEPMPADFMLRLQWRLSTITDNSGVFCRFPDPGSRNYDNPAYVPVHFGHEVQIDELARPDGLDIHRTGAIYGEADQQYTRRCARPPGWWNDFEIRVEGDAYTVRLNGEIVTRFTNTNPERGSPGTDAAPTYLGLQAYPGSRVAFRSICLQALVPGTIVPPRRRRKVHS